MKLLGRTFLGRLSALEALILWIGKSDLEKVRKKVEISQYPRNGCISKNWLYQQNRFFLYYSPEKIFWLNYNTHIIATNSNVTHLIRWLLLTYLFQQKIYPDLREINSKHSAIYQFCYFPKKETQHFAANTHYTSRNLKKLNTHL